MWHDSVYQQSKADAASMEVKSHGFIGAGGHLVASAGERRISIDYRDAFGAGLSQATRSRGKANSPRMG
jgi:hypothetical protein